MESRTSTFSDHKCRYGHNPSLLLVSRFHMSIVTILALVLLCDMALRKSIALSFYESIGKPKFISAPMVAHSSLPWRLLVRQHGADVAYTQMLHAENFKNIKQYRAGTIDWKDHTHKSGCEEKKVYAQNLDKTTIAQFAGDNPNTLVEAGRHIHHDVAAIDLNLGCPQKIAKKGNYGAYLLKDKDRIVKVLSSMVKELDCPITAKIRVLDSEQATLDLCRAIEDCGVSMLTVHGRLITANKQFTGPVNWDIIRTIKQTLSIPVVANGGIGCYEDALKCLEYTGVDAVMSSEALLENPKLFSEEGDRLFRTDFIRAQLRTANEFVQLVDEYPKPDSCENVVRSHLFKMLHRFVLVPANRDTLKLLCSRDYPTIISILPILEERLSKVDYNVELAESRGMLNSTGYYMRHRGAYDMVNTPVPVLRQAAEKAQVSI